MLPIKSFLAILLAAPAACSSLPPKSTASVFADRLHSRIPGLIAQENVAGVGIARIDAGRITDFSFYGEAAPGVPTSATTVFNTASVAKTVTAELFIRLAAEGKVDLDAPIAPLVTDTDLARDPRYRLLTPRLLLSHSSGLRNWAYDYDDGKLAFDFKPGTAFGYSGAGVELAADYAEEATGKDYRTLALNEVLAPAGADEIVPGRIEPWMDGRLARPMNADGEWISLAAANPKLPRGTSDAAADDLLATVPAYARFLQSVIADAANMEQRTRILTSVKDDPVYRCRAGTATCPRDMGHAIGWQVNAYADHDVVFHSGSDTGENALVYFSPHSGDGAVIFVNGGNGWVVMARIVELLGQEPDFADYLRNAIADLYDRDLQPLAE